jgi:NTE family protein
MTRALVLGGGGVAGIAWEAGIVTGLRQEGVDLGAADTIIGTSAGSVVGALIATGADLDAEISHQVETDTAAARAFDMEALMTVFAVLFDPAVDPKEARRQVGQAALQVTDGGERLEAIGKRLPVQTWPERDLRITAVDASTGDLVVWTRDTHASLALAVASSCAVPMVFPPVEIGGERYVDGGVRSQTSADLAEGAERVIVLDPIAHFVPPDTVAAELASTGAAHTLHVGPDQAAQAVFGMNILDPALWGPAYKAGLAQSAALADEVRAIW